MPRCPKLCATLVCLAVLGVEPPASLAATWNVPAEAPDIRSAVALAASGDTIEVEPGTYTGPGNRNIDFGGKTLLLRSVTGAASTILDCESSGRAFLFQTGEGNDAVVQGFTITNGRAGQGGGIHCVGASPTITDCVLRTNRADESGGGVFCVSGAAPRLIRCRFEGNTAFFSGSGASCINASPEIVDCVFTQNSAGILGGGIYCREASPTITRCLVEGNQSGGAGGGLVFYHLSAPLVTECTVTANRGSANAGGVFCDDSASPTFTDCLLIGNHTDGSGGALFCTSRSTATVRGSTISGNRAVQRGGGLFAEGTSRFTLERSILWGNCAPTGDEAYSLDVSSQTTFTCSDVDSSGVSGGTVTYGGGNVFADPLFCSPHSCEMAPIAGGTAWTRPLPAFPRRAPAGIGSEHPARCAASRAWRRVRRARMSSFARTAPIPSTRPRCSRSASQARDTPCCASTTSEGEWSARCSKGSRLRALGRCNGTEGMTEGSTCRRECTSPSSRPSRRAGPSRCF